VAAVLVYDRALSAAEQTQVLAYLQDKYLTTGGGGSQAPVANDDVGSVAPGGAVTLDILGNDADPDGTLDPATVFITQNPQAGVLSVDAVTGAVQYTHDGTAGTTDSFSYQVSDNEGLSSNEATVSITIGGGNPYPAGEALYQGVCFACHGTDAGGLFVRYPIRGASAETISTMINALPPMNFLAYLTTDEISDIVDYLGYVTGDDSERLSGSGDVVNGESLFRKSCTGCHALGTSPRFGPDLMGIITNCSSGGIGSFPGGSGNAPGWGACEWVEAFITEPETMATHGYTESELAAFPFTMTDLDLSGHDALDIAAFIGEQATPLVPATPVSLTAAEFEDTKQAYFNHCAGCHGLYRGGATGPVIDEVRSQEIGTDGLAAMMRYGTPGGMPNFGQAGILSEPEIDRLAAYLQLPPPEAPALEMPEIQASWEVIVPVASRPTAPQHALDWENFFGVVLRDAGKIAIFDGDSHNEISRVDVGFAVHILRSSATGRYFYAIGRDGWVSLIDLWASTPNVVARVKGCHDARSISSSKFPGYEDKHLIEGCYWPPQYVTYDGLTLEPQNLVKLPMTSITGETLQEVRVSAIVASPFAPVWVMNQKESGFVGIVDYSQAGAPIVSNIATELFLHDGGWDQTKRYYITAANGSDKMVVVDVQTESFVTSFDVGNVPHPGRGANWLDPLFGWVNVTPHIGSAFVSVYGADPENYPEHAWKVVREIAIPASGSLFIKTHPNSPWVLVDMTLSSTNDKQICAISKATGTLDRCFDVATAGKAVHMEFNKDGSEVWIADWASQGGGQIILDGTTLEVIRKIPLPATTGKFNVYNTANDIY
jgi:nitrite reductase (NO-forming)/hydroxylamine reductase